VVRRRSGDTTLTEWRHLCQNGYQYRAVFCRRVALSMHHPHRHLGNAGASRTPQAYTTPLRGR
jgi:hypothetical protein